MAHKPPLDLFVVCGEKSGDLLAAKALEGLSLRMGGVVGPELESVGVTRLFDMEAFQIMGFVTIAAHLPRLYGLFQKIKRFILTEKPKVVLLVDNAEFSLLMAKALRKGGFSGKIAQLVSPSIWAWRKSRKETMEKTLDALFCLYPFEPGHFSDSSLDALYVGHPLIGSLRESRSTPSSKAKTKISLFPGSRKHEIRLNLPMQLEALKGISDYEIAIGVSHPKLEKEIVACIKKSGLSPTLVPSENRYELMEESLFSLAKLGTVNLELAFFEVPTITMFGLPLLERWILQHGFKIFLPHYSIVNWIAEKRLFPEYIGPFLTLDNLKQEVRRFAKEPSLRESISLGCQEVKKKLEAPPHAIREKIRNLI